MVKIQTQGMKKAFLKKLIQFLKELEPHKGIVPICSVCKRVRIDPDYWTQVEAFVQNRSRAKLSPTYCPEGSDNESVETVNMSSDAPLLPVVSEHDFALDYTELSLHENRLS